MLGPGGVVVNVDSIVSVKQLLPAREGNQEKEEGRFFT